MLRLKILFKVLLVLIAATQVLDAVLVSTYENEWRIKGNATFNHGFNIADGDDTFLYIICTDERFPSEYNCNVTLEPPTSSRTMPTMTCPMKIVAARDRELVYIYMELPVKLERLDRTRALLYWLEAKKNHGFDDQWVKFEILDVSDCSRIQLTDFTLDTDRNSMSTNTIIYPDGFDIIVSKKSRCKGLSSCRLSYDKRGQQVGEPVAFNSSINTAITKPVTPKSADKGFFISGLELMQPTKFSAEHVSAVGVRTHLMSVNVSDPNDIYWVSSNAHEIFGLCWVRRGESRVHCSQFDANGNEKMSTNIEFAQSVRAMVIHNMDNGGMLLANVDCHSEVECKSFNITRIRADGSRGEEIVKYNELNLKCDDVPLRLAMDASENSYDYCFYFACATRLTIENSGSIAKYTSKCIVKQ